MNRDLFSWKVALAIGAGVTAGVGIAALTFKVLKWRQGGPRTTNMEVSRRHVYKRTKEIKKDGDIFFWDKKYFKAMKCYKQALELCPLKKTSYRSELYHYIGMMYTMIASQANDKSKKIEYFSSGVEYNSLSLGLNKRYVKTLTYRAKGYVALGRRQDALLDMMRIMVLDESQDVVTGDTLTTLLNKLGKELGAIQFPSLDPLVPTKHTIKSHLKKFVWHDDLSEQRLRELYDSYKLNLYGSQHFSDDPFLNAAAMFRNEQYDGIIEALSEAIAKGCPVFLPHALLLRGTFYITWRDNKRALVDLNAVISMAGASKMLVINALIKKATIYAGLPEKEKAMRCFDRCLQLDEACPDALIHKARVQLEYPEQDAEAINTSVEGLKKACTLAPQSPLALYTLAATYHRQACLVGTRWLLTKAAIAFETSYSKFPKYVDGLVQYAMFLQDIFQMSKAEEVLTKAVELEPDNPSVHLQFGKLALSAADLKRGSEHTQMAIEMDCSYFQAYDLLASMELQVGDSQAALDLYSTAARYARSRTELSQVLVAKELISAQHQVCQEYNISVKDFMSKLHQPSPI